MGHGPRRPLWNRVHVANEESILSEVTEREKKLRVKSFQFACPGHCAPWCWVNTAIDYPPVLCVLGTRPWRVLGGSGSFGAH